MLKIGLTGGIGSGKTRVANLFQEWGASVIDTDVIAHQLTQPEGLAMPAIREIFGTQMVEADGSMNRGAMRERVFREPQAKQALEAILHPLIAQVTEQQARQAQGCYLVLVVPLLVETGRWLKKVDRVCVVDCDPETQIKRVQARSGLTIDAIKRIMSAQATRNARLALASDVVLNDGATTPDQLSSRARELHEYWCSLV
ncbi:MAG TPA: dephospho-CoA kinase [Pusillimonas sp.]|jgi:dephospho-CoA kinase|nr:dephospho-CoA kinase [Pusillimonas sp.]MBC42778.1 dephospho-CoA kinase [Pusillimonas sp.]HBT33584.1 dephospho-CoA kinase [Pusillimonas sp.]|tara:strand:+ start:69402 stop:70001 length:600 start_codon:yes stop_codon:yes gene_type:complete